MIQNHANGARTPSAAFTIRRGSNRKVLPDTSATTASSGDSSKSNSQKQRSTLCSQEQCSPNEASAIEQSTAEPSTLSTSNRGLQSHPHFYKSNSPTNLGDDTSSSDVPDLVDEESSSSARVFAFNPVRQQVANSAAPHHTSILKSPSKSPARSPNSKSRPSTERRVRGLWKSQGSFLDDADKNSSWDKLRDETVVHCLSFLSLVDLLRVGLVGKRFHSIVQSTDMLWKQIDATDFVQTVYATFSKCYPGDTSPRAPNPQKQTGLVLEQILKLHQPETLVIRDIRDSLSAKSFLPSLPKLQELTLTHFHDLSDTHVHVMLLLMTQGGRAVPSNKQDRPADKIRQGQCQLRHLALQDCPLLTTATVRSIATQCPQLEILSLSGNTGISDLQPLSELLAVTVDSDTSPNQQQQPQPPSATTSTPPSLLSIFQPAPSPAMTMDDTSSSKPQPKNTSVLGMLQPPKTSVDPPTSLLSMFQPPVPSPAPASLPPTTPLVPKPPTVLSPPTSTASNNSSTAHLESLFALPGTSPPRVADSIPILPPRTRTQPSGISGASPLMLASKSLPSSQPTKAAGGMARMGHLCHIDVRGTSTTTDSVLQLLQGVTKTTTSNKTTSVLMAFAPPQEGKPTRRVVLECLRLDQQSSWSREQIDQLEELLASPQDILQQAGMHRTVNTPTTTPVVQWT